MAGSYRAKGRFESPRVRPPKEAPMGTMNSIGPGVHKKFSPTALTRKKGIITRPALFPTDRCNAPPAKVVEISFVLTVVLYCQSAFNFLIIVWLRLAINLTLRIKGCKASPFIVDFLYSFRPMPLTR